METPFILMLVWLLEWHEGSHVTWQPLQVY